MLTMTSLDVMHCIFIDAFKTRTLKTFIAYSSQMTSSTLIWGLKRELRCQMNLKNRSSSLRAAYI